MMIGAKGTGGGGEAMRAVQALLGIDGDRHRVAFQTMTKW
jgi:hypothetical protein